jgi:hypothetical protein
MGLFDCVGAQTIIFTDKGWKKIIHVTAEDMVWDGNGFVQHAGVIRKGVRKTIGYRGLAVTPDHKVWTTDRGWVEASDDPEAMKVDWIAVEPEDQHPTGDVEVFDILNAGPMHRFTVAIADGTAIIISNCDCACAAAPDYQPVADASAEAAKITAELGREQLAEAKRQYDDNKTAIAPILAAQKGILDSSKAQGDDYYSYIKDTFRPLESAVVADAQNFDTDGYREGQARSASLDAQRAIDNTRGQSARAMAAMGVNPNSGRFAGINKAQDLQAAAMRAGAATGARERAGNMAYARKMDAVGLGRNLPGASSGAYQVAVGAGD